MWSKPENPVPIEASQLRVGLYIWLNMPWDEHPFLQNKFRITSENQLGILRSLNLGDRLFYFANKSEVEPAPVEVAKPVEAAPAPAVAEAVSHLKEEKQAKLQRQKEAAARAERAWEQAAKSTREGMLGMARNPKQAGVQLMNLSRETASSIAQGEEILLHLLGDKEGEGPQFHALNVLTLSMLVGKMAGMNEQQLSELALGAIAHDIGKAQVPAHLLKAKTRARHEEEFYRTHGAYGIQLAQASGVFSDESLAVLADHHEYLDGTGFPSGKKTIGAAARIVALVNRYDRLCSPESPEKDSLTPAEALARLFKLESARFDPRLLSMMVKLLGVYPPGTITRLSDDSLALVVAPGKESLRPTVIIYMPEVDKKDAPILDLAEEPSLKIEEVIRPSGLPKDVLDWLNPRQRLAYFFTVENKRAE